MKVDFKSNPIGIGESYTEVPNANDAYTFAQFQEFIQKKENNGFKGYLFRGERLSKSRNLEPTALRIFKSFNKKIKNENAKYDYTNLLKKHLYQFRLNLRGRLKADSWVWKNDNEIWAIGQHYGLNTPLLDWSASIGVALFFAFEKQNKNESEVAEHRCIYFWNAKKNWENQYLKQIGIEYYKSSSQQKICKILMVMILLLKQKK